MKTVMEQERVDRDWSRTYVAKKLGVTPEMVRLIEIGRRNPSYDVLVKLENLFQKSHRQLFAVADEHQQQDTAKGGESARREDG